MFNYFFMLWVWLPIVNNNPRLILYFIFHFADMNFLSNKLYLDLSSNVIGITNWSNLKKATWNLHWSKDIMFIGTYVKFNVLKKIIHHFTLADNTCWSLAGLGMKFICISGRAGNSNFFIWTRKFLFYLC